MTFDPNNDNILWVGSPSGGLCEILDGGQNWTSNTDLLPNLGVSDIAIDPQIQILCILLLATEILMTHMLMD